MKPDPVSVPPTLETKRGKLWKIDLEALRRTGVPINSSLAFYVIEAEWAHPFWHSYALSLCHLRPIRNEPPPILYLEGATHEFILAALDPGQRRDEAMRTGNWPLMAPVNFAAQMKQPTDQDAIAIVEQAAMDIILGRLHPDTDFIQMWADRFGDSMIRDQPAKH